MNQDNLFYQPREAALNKIDSFANEPEMTVFESAFLCGLIKKYNPKKIVEIGIAGGATTSIILECLNILNYSKIQMFSIDLNTQFYRDKSKTSGFLAHKILPQINNNINHKFLLGRILPEVIEEIGHNIDFVILDTVHTIPGELLDFPVLLPFLSNNCIFVLHDIRLHLIQNKCISNQVLFNSIVGEKIILFKDGINNSEFYPNIAAVLVNNDTKKYITSVFHSLTLPWQYIPNKNHIDSYKTIIKKYYSDYEYSIFDKCISLGEITAEKNQLKIIESNKEILLEYINFMNFYTCNSYNFIIDKNNFKYAYLPTSNNIYIHYEFLLTNKDTCQIGLHFEGDFAKLSYLIDRFSNLNILSSQKPHIIRANQFSSIYFEENKYNITKTVKLMIFLINNTISVLFHNKLVSDDFIIEHRCTIN